MDFDPRFLDVEFPAFKQYTFGNIIPRDVAAAQELCASFPTFEDSVIPLPSSQWREISDEIEARKAGIEWLITRIYNQRQEGSCVGNGGGQSHEILQALQFGKENVVPLSAISLYQLIGRSANSGATVPDCIEAMSTKGIIPLDTQENRQRFGNIVMPHTGFSTRRPEGWQEVAGDFKAKEWFTIRSFDGIVTAGLLGIPIVVGRQGHCIVYLRAFFKDGRLYFLYVNSWGQWGFAAADFTAGFGADSERLVRQSAQWAFAPRAIITPSWMQAA